ncbi:macro domain-containing protein [Porticoccus sp.]
MGRIEVLIGDITALSVDVVVNAANSQLAGGGGVDGAFNLSAKYIFHAVGPVWYGGQRGEPSLLAGCYRQAMSLAGELNVASIAFPAISCGIYGYPPELAVPVAIEEVKSALEKNCTLQW